MGMFRDYRAITKTAKTMARSHDVTSDLAGVHSKIEALNASFATMALGDAARSGLTGTASILAMRATGSMINFESVCELELLVLLPGRPPIPVTTTKAIASANLQRALPGNVIKVRMMEHDSSDISIDWAVNA